MWIQTATADTTRHMKLLCDERGAIFDNRAGEDRDASWRQATVAGWARTARVPERHACAHC